MVSNQIPITAHSIGQEIVKDSEEFTSERMMALEWRIINYVDILKVMLGLVTDTHRKNSTVACGNKSSSFKDNNNNNNNNNK